MNYKLAFGILSIIPAVIAYFIYFKQMFAGRIKPHAFSWLVWGLLAGNGTIAQVSAGAGIGAWVTGLTSVACLTIFGFALWTGTTQATRLDRILLSLALISFAALFAVDSTVIALCLTLFALLTGYAMTFAKAYRKPQEENSTAFLLNALKFIPAIPALSSFSFLTVAYPVVNLLGNATIAAVILVRLRMLSRTPHAISDDFVA